MLRFFCIAILIFACAGTLFSSEARKPNRPANHTVELALPPLLDVNPVNVAPSLKLVQFAIHSRELVAENSSLEKCGARENTFWTLNDSGDGPYIFALDINGRILTPLSSKNYRGILISGRRNIDWEAIASDGNGNLVVADIGNNDSNRRNLCFYLFKEPSPFAEKVESSRKIGFYYPTQDFFPDPSKNYDSEACFCLNGWIYFFTKHWTNTETILWRVDPRREDYQAAVPVARFNSRGLVTDAALSPDGSKLAVLTYHSLWIFDLPEKDSAGTRDETKFFSSPPRFRKISVPMKHWQLEGIAFADTETLIISSESGALFSVPVSEIIAR